MIVVKIKSISNNIRKIILNSNRNNNYSNIIHKIKVKVIIINNFKICIIKTNNNGSYNKININFNNLNNFNKILNKMLS